MFYKTTDIQAESFINRHLWTLILGIGVGSKISCMYTLKHHETQINWYRHWDYTVTQISMKENPGAPNPSYSDVNDDVPEALEQPDLLAALLHVFVLWKSHLKEPCTVLHLPHLFLQNLQLLMCLRGKHTCKLQARDRSFTVPVSVTAPSNCDGQKEIEIKSLPCNL